MNYIHFINKNIQRFASNSYTYHTVNVIMNERNEIYTIEQGKCWKHFITCNLTT